MCYRSDMSGSDSLLLCLVTAHCVDVGTRDNLLEKITTSAAELSCECIGIDPCSYPKPL